MLQQLDTYWTPPKNDMNLLKADVWFRGNSQPVSLSLYSFSSQCEGSARSSDAADRG